MNRSRFVLLLSFTLVALLAVSPAAGAKTKAALPDLVVKKVSKPPKTKTVGTKLKLVIKVANKGGGKAAKSQLGLYLGKGKKHTKKDKRLKRVKVKPLAAGKGKKLKLRVTIPAKTKVGAYRLFACADDAKKVKESKERNCKGTRKLSLVAKAAPLGPPAAAFTMGHGLDWGFISDAQREQPEPGDPVTLSLTAGNGIAGQAGYTRAAVAPEGFRNGTTTVLDFGGSEREDDGQATVQLPFAFPFGGIDEQAISVSTNGWAGFGAPAWDYWDDTQTTDYRGIQTVVGELYRGLMPYWSDMTIEDFGKGAGPGIVREVVAPDNSWVAFQWDVGSLTPEGVPRRTFQLVLFPDGSFRFDYPGENAPGGNKSFTGFSLGTGAASADVVSAEGDTVPSSSFLFTPNALPGGVAGPTAAGEVTALLPKGSSFVSADPGCALTTAPAQFSTGLVTCSVPALTAGQQVSHGVTFSMPAKAPVQKAPANFRLLGSYATGGVKLTDGDEIDRLTTSLEPTSIDVEYLGLSSGPLEVGTPETAEFEIKAESGGLDEPSAEFKLTKGTISSVKIGGETIECDPASGGSVACLLPSGLNSTSVEVNFVVSELNPSLQVAAKALNAEAGSIGISFL
ncbi:MAG TPA: CARDB domain-containing protein [Solirubrobacterales bacterium]|nr:CARDB domain-containing protein [Solirubrobacterales bacterium]